jgi:PilZ domain-containing protein
MRPHVPERRSTERFPIPLEGWFAGEATGDPIACTVWDMSETGVRLVIPSPADVPLEFELKIPNAQAVAMVRLVWSDGNHFGVRFTG